MASDLWPYNPRSVTPDSNIDWQTVERSAFETARSAVLRKVNVKSLGILRTRYKHSFALMTPAAQEQVNALVEGRPADKEILKTEEPIVVPDGPDRKSKLMNQLTALKGDAEGDVALQLKIIELEAKLDSLLNQKAQTDAVVNIFVNTGVVR